MQMVVLVELNLMTVLLNAKQLLVTRPTSLKRSKRLEQLVVA